MYIRRDEVNTIVITNPKIIKQKQINSTESLFVIFPIKVCGIGLNGKLSFTGSFTWFNNRLVNLDVDANEILLVTGSYNPCTFEDALIFSTKWSLQQKEWLIEHKSILSETQRISLGVFNEEC